MSKLKKYASRMIVTSVTIILIIIIGITANGRTKITFIENTVGKIITPVQKFFNNIGEGVSGTIESIGNLGNLKEENELLSKENSQLKELNRKYEDIIMRTDFLRDEAELKKQTDFVFVSAKVSGKDPGNWFDRFMIDKGTNDGIKKGDPVIQAVRIEENVVEEGLIGRISEVGDNWAKVMSIIDEGSSVSYKIIRTQDGGMLSGSLDGEMKGYLFDSEANVIDGDKLLTSGLGGIFVEGLYIGKIVKFEKKQEDLIESIYVEPVIDFKNIHNVYVVTGTKK
ncbi:rod shape-determining protein MreC [Sporosalibacterium faouarense]|uniref:rod shape-determining protein MreC n=1 Tax=Sporosalibacterium faouarense TaxID=516123 RepID=UPI00141D61FE|nr:rod shape-determining protein MreC [Sporosalibacterium faouarense]MTI48513.1 rod shape-determining protein MreC [Bacillota bacterium]